MVIGPSRQSSQKQAAIIDMDETRPMVTIETGQSTSIGIELIAMAGTRRPTYTRTKSTAMTGTRRPTALGPDRQRSNGQLPPAPHQQGPNNSLPPALDMQGRRDQMADYHQHRTNNDDRNRTNNDDGNQTANFHQDRTDSDVMDRKSHLHRVRIEQPPSVAIVFSLVAISVGSIRCRWKSAI